MAYDRGYESKSIRGREECRPWNIIEVIKKYLKKNDVLLDIGCGTAFKTLKYSGKVKTVYGLEPSTKMLKTARRNIKKCGRKNFCLVVGYAENMPFDDNFFDIVTCIMSPHDTKELHRVLKPGGWAILEKLGDRDQWNIKQEFGSDAKGLRGQLAHFRKGERKKLFMKEFGNLFSSAEIESKFWKTWYAPEELASLLKQTPLVRNYNTKKDREVLNNIEKKYLTPKGIKTCQNRLLIIAKK